MHSNISRNFLVALASLALSLVPADSQTVDQSQTGVSSTDDLSSSGRSGQTFVAGVDAPLLAIRLVVEARGNASIFGSDFVLSLRSTIKGTPTDSVLATGNFSRSTLTPNVAQWVTVTLNTPYQQSAGEGLAFTIQELAGGGVLGFNDYGSAANDPYKNGQRFFGYTAGQSLTASSRDFTFETIVVPEPASPLLIALGAAAISGVRHLWRRFPPRQRDFIGK